MPLSAGKKIRVKSVRATLNVAPQSSSLCCDVWIYLGDSPFGFPSGGGPVAQGYPGWAKPNDPNITQVQMVLNGTGFQPQRSVEIWGSYDFDRFLEKGYPRITMKTSKNPEMELTEGIYAQILVWTGDPTGPVDINKVSLEAQIEVMN